MKRFIKDVGTIRDAAKEAIGRHAKGWSADEILCNPDVAKAICKDVRKQLGRKLEDSEICRTILNARKQSKLK